MKCDCVEQEEVWVLARQAPDVAKLVDIAVLKREGATPLTALQNSPQVSVGRVNASGAFAFHFTLEPKALTRYRLDKYGRPRPLTKTEIALDTLARAVVAGAILGFSIAIFIAASHRSSMGAQHANEDPATRQLKVASLDPDP